MEPSQHIPRFIETNLRQIMSSYPVVLLTGARGSGKSTLACQFGHDLDFETINFDDPKVLDAVREDSERFLRHLPERCILDEVQKIPEIYPGLQRHLEANPKRGHLILTASTNTPALKEFQQQQSTTTPILQMYPLSQTETRGTDSHFLRQVFSREFHPSLPESPTPTSEEVATLLQQSTKDEAYLQERLATILQDSKDLGTIRHQNLLIALYKEAAKSTGRLLNISQLAKTMKLTAPTIRSYMTMLKNLSLLDELPPIRSARSKRLVQTPKLHVFDAAQFGTDLSRSPDMMDYDRETAGRMLESLVYQELRAMASWQPGGIAFSHYRDKDGVKIDFVMQGFGRQIAAVDVKNSTRITKQDFAGLRKIKRFAGSRFQCGVILYTGERRLRYREDLFALPVKAVWSANSLKAR
jgi:uncharacterized protein